MFGSSFIIAEEDWLDNVHPGDILREDFLIGSEIPLAEVAEGAQIRPAVLAEIVVSRRDIDASIDVRLTRYFGMSDGFFCGCRTATTWRRSPIARRTTSRRSSAVPPEPYPSRRSSVFVP